MLQVEVERAVSSDLSSISSGPGVGEELIDTKEEPADSHNLTDNMANLTTAAVSGSIKDKGGPIDGKEHSMS